VAASSQRGKDGRCRPLLDQARILKCTFCRGVIVARACDFDDDRPVLRTVSDGIAAQNEVSPVLVAEPFDISNTDRFAEGSCERGFGCGHDILLVEVA
jgi:hypothetical protein